MTRSRSLIVLFSLPLVLLAGCGGGGGGGGSGSSGSSSLEVLAVVRQNGELLPGGPIFLNERISLYFSTSVDPTTVHSDSISIRRLRGGFAEAARGSFVVNEKVVSFVPFLPSRSDLSDAGLRPGETYRISLRGSPVFDTVRTLSGRPLAHDFEVFVDTRADAPFLLDTQPGPPRVVAVALDLDGNGRLDADGDASTISDEEFMIPLADPLLRDAPLGLARSPLSFGLVLSEPVLPESVFEDSDGDGRLDNVDLLDVDRGVPIPVSVRLDQKFLPDQDRFSVIITLEPGTALPTSDRIEVILREGIFDFATPAQPLPALVAAIETRSGPDTLQDALEEDFDDRRSSDPSTTAQWGTQAVGILTAGVGIGGSGADGPLIVPQDSVVTLDTSVNGGFFNFTVVELPASSSIQVRGPNPLRIFSTSDITLHGRILLEGGRGLDGMFQQGELTIPGGAGGPGGGAPGGPANSPPFTFGGRALAGASPVVDGGGRGAQRAMFPGGGGGGGYAQVGATCFAVNIWCGMGGVAYGNPEIATLFGGSGGGAGGNEAMVPPALDTTGGSGGGGGGAIALECAGRFTFTGTLSVNGGSGGDGGPALPGAGGGGGGGGGSGGSIRVRAFEVADIDTVGSRLTAEGGNGGTTGGGQSAGGAAGSRGRIALAAFDRNRDGQANDFRIDFVAASVAPPPTRSILNENILGKSFALSRFLGAGSSTTRYRFDGSDPTTGRALEGPGIRDLLIPDGIPERSSVHIFFQGALADPTNPHLPDPSTATELTPRISDLNGYPFIRYRIDLDVGSDLDLAETPRIERLVIPFEIDI